MLKHRQIELRTTSIDSEVWDETLEDYVEVTKGPEIKKALEDKLTEARKYIAEAAIIAKENNIEFRPLGDLFTDSEIENQGWNSSNC